MITEKFDLSTVSIGDHFFLNEREYMITDKGTRVLVAVEIDKKARKDPSWLQGPTYALAEQVFDEDDQAAITLKPSS